MLVERMQHFVFPTVVNPTPSVGLSLRVDLDASFRLFGVVIWNLGVTEGTGAEGQLAIRFSRPDGRLIQRQLTASNLLFPGNQYNQAGLSPNKAMVCPIHPGVLYPAGSVINMDLMGLPTGIGAPAGVIVVFVGTNIYQDGAVWNPQYPAKWKARPYLDFLTVSGIDGGGGSETFSGEEPSGSIKFSGVGGTNITLSDTNIGHANRTLSVTVVGDAITVEVATDAGGNETSTVSDVVAAITASGPASALVTALQVAAGTLPVPNFGILPGSGASSFPILNQPFTAQADSDFVWQAGAYTDTSGGDSFPAVDQLLDLGVIVRDTAYKAYSNDYVPAALLFPFLTAQAPGWLYPEIYIPRLGQIYFDFDYLTAGANFTTTPIALTLGLKGMKVYPQ